jgi:hypothetical protein
VNRRCACIEGQRPFEILRGLGELTPRKRCAPCAEERRRRLRLNGNRALKAACA